MKRLAIKFGERSNLIICIYKTYTYKYTGLHMHLLRYYRSLYYDGSEYIFQLNLYLHWIWFQLNFNIAFGKLTTSPCTLALSEFTFNFTTRK